MENEHIVIESDKDFHSLASQLKVLLNVAESNRTDYQKEQKRYGLNVGGGDYYLFEILGLELYVLRNEGKVQLFDNKWPYYLTVQYSYNIEPETFKWIINYINQWLRQEGFVTEIIKETSSQQNL